MSNVDKYVHMFREEMHRLRELMVFTQEEVAPLPPVKEEPEINAVVEAKAAACTLTQQQVFDRCVSGVLAQGRPGRDGDGDCVILSDEGHRCAIGFALTADELPVLRENKLTMSTATDADLWELFPVFAKHWQLLLDLQRAHDDASSTTNQTTGFQRLYYGKRFTKRFKLRARNVAKSWDLSDAVITRFDELLKATAPETPAEPKRIIEPVG